ncbi:MAG TPA: TetR family transcriptional regulator [Solirubrobacteraceae bacterium]|nr:TetR family transcriptional regulator [Solirubrobacteraceae bacterium]
MTQARAIDDQTIALITERVVAALREELEAIAMSLLAENSSHPLTVGEVAERFGVARSTVYAHWREWGGYKLGDRAKAPIRFEGDRLPTRPAADEPDESALPKRPTRRRRRRDLIADAPRFDHSIEELG